MSEVSLYAERDPSGAGQAAAAAPALLRHSVLGFGVGGLGCDPHQVLGPYRGAT